MLIFSVETELQLTVSGICKVVMLEYTLQVLFIFVCFSLLHNVNHQMDLLVILMEHQRLIFNHQRHYLVLIDMHYHLHLSLLYEK